MNKLDYERKKAWRNGLIGAGATAAAGLGVAGTYHALKPKPVVEPVKLTIEDIDRLSSAKAAAIENVEHLNQLAPELAIVKSADGLIAPLAAVGVGYGAYKLARNAMESRRRDYSETTNNLVSEVKNRNFSSKKVETPTKITATTTTSKTPTSYSFELDGEVGKNIDWDNPNLAYAIRSGMENVETGWRDQSKNLNNGAYADAGHKIGVRRDERVKLGADKLRDKSMLDAKITSLDNQGNQVGDIIGKGFDKVSYTVGEDGKYKITLTDGTDYGARADAFAKDSMNKASAAYDEAVKNKVDSLATAAEGAKAIQPESLTNKVGGLIGSDSIFEELALGAGAVALATHMANKRRERAEDKAYAIDSMSFSEQDDVISDLERRLKYIASIQYEGKSPDFDDSSVTLTSSSDGSSNTSRSSNSEIKHGKNATFRNYVEAAAGKKIRKIPGLGSAFSKSREIVGGTKLKGLADTFDSVGKVIGAAAERAGDDDKFGKFLSKASKGLSGGAEELRRQGQDKIDSTVKKSKDKKEKSKPTEEKPKDESSKEPRADESIQGGS